MRAAFHRLPYTAIPKVMIKILAMESTNKLNFFPPKGGVSKYYSPRMILTGDALDYNRHCSIPFGTYVQAHNENNPTNTMAARALDCIYLRPIYNQQEFYTLVHPERNLVQVPVLLNSVRTPCTALRYRPSFSPCCRDNGDTF